MCLNDLKGYGLFQELLNRTPQSLPERKGGTLSSPVCEQDSRNCGHFERSCVDWSQVSVRSRLRGGACSLALTLLCENFPAHREKYRGLLNSWGLKRHTVLPIPLICRIYWCGGIVTNREFSGRDQGIRFPDTVYSAHLLGLSTWFFDGAHYPNHDATPLPNLRSDTYQRPNQFTQQHSRDYLCHLGSS
jgi:hypothetical protein